MENRKRRGWFYTCPRKIALHIAGLFYALWLLTRNLLGRLYVRLRYGSADRQALKAIRKANELCAATGYTYFVLQAKGRVIIKPKRLIKHQLACRGKYYRRGTTIQDIERIALYIAKNQPRNS